MPSGADGWWGAESPGTRREADQQRIQWHTSGESRMLAGMATAEPRMQHRPPLQQPCPATSTSLEPPTCPPLNPSIGTLVRPAQSDSATKSNCLTGKNPTKLPKPARKPATASLEQHRAQSAPDWGKSAFPRPRPWHGRAQGVRFPSGPPRPHREGPQGPFSMMKNGRRFDRGRGGLPQLPQVVRRAGRQAD